jgi:hypothetical protein
MVNTWRSVITVTGSPRWQALKTRSPKSCEQAAIFIPLLSATPGKEEKKALLFK